MDEVLAEVVQRLLAKRWSPEQVAHELRVLFAGQPSRWLCKETIYQAIYDAAVAIDAAGAAPSTSPTTARACSAADG